MDIPKEMETIKKEMETIKKELALTVEKFTDFKAEVRASMKLEKDITIKEVAKIKSHLEATTGYIGVPKRRYKQ